MNNKVEIKSISNKEKYIVAKDIFFEIPPYQRLYEWNKEQIQTLLNDIKTKFEENKNEEYFIGNVVVSKKNNKNNQQDVKYLLIDGQQRLTTLFLIGFYLSYKIKNPNNDSNWKEFIMQGDKLRISMSIREKEEKALKEFAKFCDEANKDNKSENKLFLQKIKKIPQDICQNISQALETIANWFEENAKDDIANFSNFIYNNVKFVFVELAQNTDLNRFFIRMNNRGKQLEKHEILKARLLKNISDKERILYAHIWDICSQMDNYIFQKTSDRKISKLNESNDSNWKEFIMQGDKLRISMSIREKEEKALKEFAKFCDEANKDNKSENKLFLQKIKKIPQDICQNISQALETIANWFEENAKDDIANFSNFIYNNVKFVFVELAQNTDLNRFFIRMNNRGKQLEKHEILKARLLKNISDKERILYAHIWDICSQMDNYIFQKTSDRKISKLNESNENTIDTIDTIINRSFDKPNQDEEKQEKFKSIVDFPTFLLHVYKICNKQDITIDKNKLLEIIKIEDSGKAKAFIENL